MSGLGWNPEDEDRHAKAIRAVEVPLTVSAPADIPDTFDPSSWFRPENQGSLNSCCGNARAGLMEYLNWIETKHVEQFSRRFAYVTAKMVDAKAGFGRLSRDEGATINGGILASKEYGECLEPLADFRLRGREETQAENVHPGCRIRRLRPAAEEWCRRAAAGNLLVRTAGRQQERVDRTLARRERRRTRTVARWIENAGRRTLAGNVELTRDGLGRQRARLGGPGDRGSLVQEFSIQGYRRERSGYATRTPVTAGGAAVDMTFKESCIVVKIAWLLAKVLTALSLAGCADRASH